MKTNSALLRLSLVLFCALLSSFSLHAQVAVDYWILDPIVVDTNNRQSVTLTVQTSGSPSMVKLVLADGSEQPLENQGGGRFVTAILHEQAIYGYSADDAKHNFVGHLDLGTGNRPNLFINVDDGTVPATTLLDLDTKTRISSRAANFQLSGSEVADSDITRITGMFYEYFPDDFDFLNVVSEAATSRDVHFSNVKNSISGLGLELFDDSHRFGSTGRLEGVIVFPSPAHFDLAAPHFLRAMGYNWMNYSTHPKLKGATPHWPISDLASGIMGYQRPGSQQHQPFPYWFMAEIAGDYQNVYQTGRYFLVPASPSGEFNYMELYLMGLVPASSGHSFLVLDNQHQQVCSCIVDGPLVNYGVRDLVSQHGVRSPDYEQARKDFKVATIIVSSDRLLSATELRYFDHMAARGELSRQLSYSSGFTKGSAKPFHLATSGRGTLDARISTDLDYAAGEFQINPGINDAWYSPATSGQGFLITVFPEIKQMFLAWFTFDTERPPGNVSAILGDPGHRWLTAQGPYDGTMANLTIYLTEGGVFNAAQPAATSNPAGEGTLTIEFADCSEGLVSYEIKSLGISGVIPIQRVSLDNIALCETLSAH